MNQSGVRRFKKNCSFKICLTELYSASVLFAIIIALIKNFHHFQFFIVHILRRETWKCSRCNIWFRIRYIFVLEN